MAKVGLVNGCFDLYHKGHARFLWEAKKLCEYLVVGVNTDESVRALKGPSRPIYRLNQRMDCVSTYADQVVPFDGNVQALLDSVRPHIVIRGWDQRVEIPGPDTIILPRYGSDSTTQLESSSVPYTSRK